MIEKREKLIIHYVLTALFDTDKHNNCMITADKLFTKSPY